MIRLANPGSDIDGMTRFLQALAADLSARASFSLDDMRDVAIARNLMTAYGFSGDEAVVRSTRPDRSRDGLFNNCKMYSELYRLLGWVRPTTSKAHGRLTWLGEHVGTVGPDYRGLVSECLLGIAFPSPNIGVKGTAQVRLFAAILRSAADLDGMISRDEIIAGPMSLQNDRDATEYAAMIASLKRMRARPGALEARLDEISADRQIERNTMCNYTRFPMAALLWTGWTESKASKAHHGRTVDYRNLTSAGGAAARWVATARDLRASDLATTDGDAARAASLVSTLDLLVRSGFSLGVYAAAHADALRVLAGSDLALAPDVPILFSVFQEGSEELVNSTFPRSGSSSVVAIPSRPANQAPLGGSGRAAAVSTDVRLTFAAVSTARVEGPATRLFHACVARVGGDREQVVDALMHELGDANQSTFYPLVADLFRVLGFDCATARPGVNYQRADAFITHAQMSVPIEIKSPGEEQFISVKGVRQAAENKVILLARKAAPTTRDATSLVVGYLPPNERAEVGNLMDDIFTAFSITIGLIDLRALLHLAFGCLYGERRVDPPSILRLRGFINVIDS